MHKSSMLILTIFALIVSIVLILYFFVVPSLDHHIDWTMYGTLVDSEGHSISTTEFTIKGSFHDIGDDEHELILSILFPDTFQYMYDREYEPSSTYCSFIPKHYGLQYFIVDGFSYNRTTNKSIKSSYALCHKNEYAIFRWNDGTDCWLVASTDPNTDPHVILQYFQFYQQLYPSVN